MRVPNKNEGQCLAESESLAETQPSLRHAFRHVYGFILQAVKGDKAAADAIFEDCVVVLIWINYSAQLVLMGAEFTHVYARRYGSLRSGPDRRRGESNLRISGVRRLTPQECAARADFIGGFRKPTEKS
jgi:hypothetical protein